MSSVRWLALTMSDGRRLMEEQGDGQGRLAFGSKEEVSNGDTGYVEEALLVLCYDGA